MTELLDGLRAELARLAEIYLPKEPLVLPAPQDQERARAFALFAHAEIEWYIERATESYLVKVCEAAQKGAFNFSSLSLIAFSEAKFSVGESLGGKKDGRTVATVFGKIQSDLKMVIEGNNGIREKNLSKILGPLGLAGRIDPAWLSDLDSLASMRGRFAHMSGGAGTTVVGSINPEDVRKLCSRIVEGDGVVGRPQIASISDMDYAFEGWKSEFTSIVSARRSIVERFMHYCSRFIKAG